MGRPPLNYLYEAKRILSISFSIPGYSRQPEIFRSHAMVKKVAISTSTPENILLNFQRSMNIHLNTIIIRYPSLSQRTNATPSVLLSTSPLRPHLAHSASSPGFTEPALLSVQTRTCPQPQLGHELPSQPIVFICISLPLNLDASGDNCSFNIALVTQRLENAINEILVISACCW